MFCQRWNRSKLKLKPYVWCAGIFPTEARVDSEADAVIVTKKKVRGGLVFVSRGD